MEKIVDNIQTFAALVWASLVWLTHPLRFTVIVVEEDNYIKDLEDGRIYNLPIITYVGMRKMHGYKNQSVEEVCYYERWKNGR